MDVPENLGYSLALNLRAQDLLAAEFAEAKREHKEAVERLKQEQARLMDRIESAQHEFDFALQDLQASTGSQGGSDG